jgi:putative cardiolipin synthase
MIIGAGRRAALGGVALWLTGCAVGPVGPRVSSTALPLAEAVGTRLGQAVAPIALAHPGSSGVHPLGDAHDAFAARILLAQAAERTLDVQYYIWANDLTGTMMFEELRAAAERGVRVRLLLDDLGTHGLDGTLAALDTHPQIEVRLFNPFRQRRQKWLGFVTNFRRANRRMHNKSFTADNQASIVGGRNIGDAYFGARTGIVFADLDALLVGTVVADVSEDFDRYWASGSSYPLARIVPPATNASLDRLGAAAERVAADPHAAPYRDAVRETDFSRALLDGTLPLEWATTHMVSDDPAKGRGKAKARDLMTTRLNQAIGTPTSRVFLVAPYFVPTSAGVTGFSDLAADGVDVRVLTNSLDATDVAAVHAGYAKRRKQLLKQGVRLFEMRRLSDAERNGERARPGAFGSSGASLHAKTFAIDGERIFIGSFNFDPRSAHLNTEMGFVIDSPVLAQQVEETFEQWVPDNAYQLELSAWGSVHWYEPVESRWVRHDREPRVGLFRRGLVGFLKVLPIEWLL